MAALVLSASLGLAVAMMFAWLIQHDTNDSGWVDVVWSIALGMGGVCDVGLWSWSRQPNYFFEWLG